MEAIGRPALILALLSGAAPLGPDPSPAPASRAARAASLPPRPGAVGPGDTLPGPDTLTRTDTVVPEDTVTERDTFLLGDTIDPHLGAPLSAHGSRLDSLRLRTEELRAAITRLRIRHDAAVHRVGSGLRFLIPFPTGSGRDGAAPDGPDPLEQIGALVRRYYPSASVYVRGTLPGSTLSCGSREERRRAREAAERLTGGGGLAAERVRRGECAAGRLTADDAGVPGPAPSTGVTVVVAWDSGADSG